MPPFGKFKPAVGGLVFGLLLLALPQMYGVGYPVMYDATAGRYALWFIILLAFAKIAATGLTIGVGGSGGVFAPSLFIGVTSGMTTATAGWGGAEPSRVAGSVLALGNNGPCRKSRPLTPGWYRMSWWIRCWRLAGRWWRWRPGRWLRPVTR